MKYLLILLISMSILINIQFGFGSATSTYIGPYHVEFNDTSHLDHMFSMSPIPIYKIYKDISGKDVIISAIKVYYAYKTCNNSKLDIFIDEGKIEDDWPSNLSFSEPMEGFVETQKFDRVIAGLDATCYKYRNTSSGWASQLAVFAFKVHFKDYDYGANNAAVVNIRCYNYTDDEFDRLLDTFKIYRLKED